MSKIVVQHSNERLLSHALDDIIKRAQVDELSVWWDGGYAADFAKFPTLKKFTAIIN